MKAHVNENCTACRICVGICPEVFSLDNGDIATVIVPEIPKEFEDACRDAAESCPVEAITIEE